MLDLSLLKIHTINKYILLKCYIIFNFNKLNKQCLVEKIILFLSCMIIFLFLRHVSIEKSRYLQYNIDNELKFLESPVSDYNLSLSMTFNDKS